MCRRLALLALAACSATRPAPRAEPRRDLAPVASATRPAELDAGAPDASVDAGPPPELARWDALVAAASDDPMASHRTSREGLLALLEGIRVPEGLPVGPLPAQINQGNKLRAHHAISRRTCLLGLRGVTLQTAEQRERCGGSENMVPVWDKGDRASVRFCVDVFEFPNRACELPLVWVRVAQAAQLCAAQGKRLCDQGEWNLACRADPGGGADRVYAYGDQLDLTVCNTNKSRATRPPCSFGSMNELWATCPTETEPSGAFPQCRSRFGVYDQHGNVAEIMTRRDFGGTRVSQLKGSASFYVDVATTPSGWNSRARYPDHCNFDPRWHVEPAATGGHFNYHLGFRCCRDVTPPGPAAPAPADRSIPSPSR